ncbi:cytochrome P450 [Nocardiopsis sp. RSe5-2]|uniref:Cytochrome P450 n=1 Tax=Nocardiopsis endophytica TaxID=3018445 RepID=A0ABT4UBJ1_9ACTN|nr:cytochrome P450 [Nocardiopsis endophytica]MDA2813829.1 cytochrome P450 [Nocardiopsis endophytica]
MTASDTVFDLGSPEFMDDIPGGYARMRDGAPLVRIAFPGVDYTTWMATRYDVVRDVLNDPRFMRDATRVPGLEGAGILDQLVQAFGITDDYKRYMRGLLTTDGDDHARLRKLVSRAFTVRRVNDLRPRIRTIAEQALDALEGREEFDVLWDYGFPVSGNVICELVGIEESERPQWRAWMHTIAEGAPERYNDSFVLMVDAVLRNIADRRALAARGEAPDDLLTALIHARDEDGGRLSEDELVAMVLIIVQGGHHTTAHFVANSVLALQQDPDQLSVLRDDPGLMPRAVHELLRLHGPAPMAGVAHAKEDVELHGVRIPQGDAVVCALAGANRDPAAFPEPERLDVAREPAGRRETHVSFGHGPHYCLGAALARTEGEVALDLLLERYPDMALAVAPEDLERFEQPGSRHLTSLPVWPHGGA